MNRTFFKNLSFLLGAQITSIVIAYFVEFETFRNNLEPFWIIIASLMVFPYAFTSNKYITDFFGKSLVTFFSIYLIDLVSLGSYYGCSGLCGIQFFFYPFLFVTAIVIGSIIYLIKLKFYTKSIESQLN